MTTMIRWMLPCVWLLFVVWGSGDSARARQDEERVVVRGMSVYGHDREDEMPLIIRDSVDSEGKGADPRGYITIHFDAIAPDPFQFKIRFYHCTRDWQPDENLFVQDIYHNTTHTLNYESAPNGVHGYKYRYVNRFPDKDDIVRFEYSGNWIFRIMDNAETVIYEEGRFFVADQLTPASMHVANDYLTANASPFNQIHKVDVRIPLADETQSSYYTTVDVYQNRRFYHPYRIDVSDRDPYTFVDGLGRGYRTFSISEILPGNEYRTLDISSPSRYPNGMPVRSQDGVDQQRLYWRTGPDRNGTAMLNRFSGINSEYLDMIFRLDLTPTDLRSVTNGGRDIYVVGPFNDWEPRLTDKLTLSDEEHCLAVHEWLRRGIYDYQYITGVWNDQDGFVRDQDWTVLEGNDWRTTDTYVAMVYYNEPRFGGFDRIVGVAQGFSNPSANVTR